MDEQMTTPQSQEAISEPTYAPEPVETLPQEPTFTEPEPELQPETYDEQPPENSELPNEVTLNEDGEVNFSDDFFGDMPQAEPEKEQPKYYTDDELKQIPFEQWDINRLNGDIRRYVPIYQEQMARRQATANVIQRPNNPSFMMAEPKPYTPKELSEEAQKLACEKLGLSDPDDFDDYEGEHRAALSLAMQELAQKRQAEVANYQRVSNEYQNLQRYNAELVNRPDFGEFDRWFSGKLVAKGLTPQQVNAGLLRYAQKSGGNFGAVQGVIANWYRQFQAERGTSNRQPQRQRAARPPVLEGAGGSGYDTRRSVNLNNFGDMDMDGQAQALMNMGIV